MAVAVTLGLSGGCGPPEACTLEPDPGECDAFFTRWYFDPDLGACAPFQWGGCGGVVPFESEIACQGTCE